MRIVDPVALLGENYAVDYLQKRNIKIIERNFRRGYGEIDIIALDSDTVVFIEVKTRKSKHFGNPLEAITYYKLKTLRKTIQYYCYTHPFLPPNIRLDAIGILLTQQNTIQKLEHITHIGV